jgi:hypothetical protein
MKNILTIILIAASVCPQKNCDQAIKPASGWPIIHRKGDVLYEGSQVFRFFGLAAPNIQQNESQLLPDFSNRFPDDFEIRDILEGLKRVGSRATRTFSLSVHSALDNRVPAYISGRRIYNEDAFRCLDRVIALCHQYDIRLIIPFIASQSFPGIRGVDEFSDLAGKPKGAFWTDESVKNDFKHFLDFILNRRNTVNGLLYKEDPAILCWQLGNEFGSYAGDRKLSYAEWTPRIQQWCIEMAAYIKKQDPNHLLMEAGGTDREAMITDPNIDIISDHLYEYWNRMGGQPWELSPIAKASSKTCKGRKPLMVDEFGLGDIENLRSLMETIRESNIVGGLLWSIRGRRRDGGWYYHNEGGTPVNSYHLPGFAVGHAYEERRMLDLLRQEAYAIRNLPVPAISVPRPAPTLMLQGKGFTWRGSAGAESYSIERADSPQGPFTVIASGLHDAVIADVASFEHRTEASWPQVLYTDESTRPGTKYFYRIKAVNVAGASEYSPVVAFNR